MKAVGLHKKVRLGERLVLAGVVCLALGLSLPAYYAHHQRAVGSFQTFGPTVVFLIVAGLLGVAVVVSAAFERSSAVPIATAVWATWSGLAATVCALVRVFERSGVASGTYLELVGALFVLTGSWFAMKDERTDIYQSPELEEQPPPKVADGSGAA